MSDDALLVAIFKEVAIIQGKRAPDGTWTNATPWHVQNALETAMRIIDNAQNAAPRAKKVDLAFETTRKS